MNQKQFIWWLQGMLSSGAPTDKTQTDRVKEELQTVFKDHIDPSYPIDKQAALQQAHQGQPNGNSVQGPIQFRC